MTTLKKLRAYLRRPFTQVLLLIIMVGAASSSTEHVHEFYRDGAHWNTAAVIEHIIAVVALTLLFRKADQIEARMKAGDKA